jgi:hypothetical protein
MVLLRDVDQVVAHFGSFGDSINLDARLVHGLRRTCNRLKNCFGHSRWNSYIKWVKWNLFLVHMKIVLMSVQDRCMVCTECTIGSEIILDPPDGTPTWRGSSEAHIGPFGDNVNLDARMVHGLYRMFHRLRNHFGCTRWYTYVTWIKLKLILVHLEIVLMSTQDRCTVCAEHVTGSEMILDAPMELLRHVGQVEARLSLFRDSVHLGAR